MKFKDLFKRSTAMPTTVVEGPSRVPRVSRNPIRRGTRSFDAGKTDRFTSNWTTTPLTADQVVDRNHRTLVARSREQAAKNDYMKSFVRLCRQNIVGHKGIILQAQSRDQNSGLDRGANDAIEVAFRDWSRGVNCDVKGQRSFRRLCQTAINTAAVDGEYMFREIVGSEAGPYGYALQVLDPMRCPVDLNQDNMPGGRMIRQGIEYSRAGRPLAFYFISEEQAEFAYSNGGRNFARIPAEEIIHGFREDMVGQRRGLPWAATSLWRMNMLGEFEKAALTNARIGASQQGFFEWAENEGPEEDEDDFDEEYFLDVEPGSWQELPPGLRSKEVQSQYPNGEFHPFHKAMLRGAGAGMGVAYVSLANDLEGVNFSSIRQGVLDEREHWMDLQEWLIETLIERVYLSWLKQALLRRKIPAGSGYLKPANIAKFKAVLWQARRWSWIDPVKDVKAAVEQKNNLLTSPSEIIRASGKDPAATWRTWSDDIKAMQDAGIPDQFITAAVLGAAQPEVTEAPNEEGTD